MGEICVANFKAPLWMVWVWVVNKQGWSKKTTCLRGLKAANKLRPKLIAACCLWSSTPEASSQNLYLKCNLRRGQFYKKMKYLQTETTFLPQSHRVTELQTPKGTQHTGGWNFFLPDFKKLDYSLCLQGYKYKLDYIFSN